MLIGSRQSLDNGRPIIAAGLLATGLGVLGALLIAATAKGGPHWSAGLQLALYMICAIAIAGLVGLIFAVPRTRTETVENSTERYSANSNLEQISDWLTKILVGAGLVQLAAVPRGLRSLGEFLGADLPLTNPDACAVAFVLYGLGTGFLFVYLWVRLRLRVLLEQSEKQAEEASQTKKEVEASLSAASAKSTAPDSKASISRVAEATTAAAMSRPARVFRSVLWVDDYPSNNVDLVNAMRALGITVDLALSTDEALRVLDPQVHGLVVTDLGRKEGGKEHEDAGLELIRAIRGRDISVPIFVYAGRRAVQRSNELTEAGAALATNRPTELFSRAVEVITGAAPRIN